VRVWLCFGVVVWFFGAVFGWAFGCQRACEVCSRLLEMADFRVPPASRGEPRRGSVSPACRFPLLREGNQKGSVPPACRFLLLREGNPIGSVPPACRGNRKEGVRNFANFRTPFGAVAGQGLCGAAVSEYLAGAGASELPVAQHPAPIQQQVNDALGELMGVAKGRSVGYSGKVEHHDIGISPHP
jgi:hypothetical protein